MLRSLSLVVSSRRPVRPPRANLGTLVNDLQLIALHRPELVAVLAKVAKRYADPIRGIKHH